SVAVYRRATRAPQLSPAALHDALPIYFEVDAQGCDDPSLRVAEVDRGAAHFAAVAGQPAVAKSVVIGVLIVQHLGAQAGRGAAHLTTGDVAVLDRDDRAAQVRLRGGEIMQH